MSDSRSSEIRNIKLELLRSGPAHNQLLSPLTSYIALCGADGPVTIQLPFEHRQLLMRLQRLRYPMNQEPGTDEQRQAEIRDIGEVIGRALGQIPALLSELGSAGSDKRSLVHLRLALSAFELGMIPFEAAVAPDGFPGSGAPLFLQMHSPISITREIRRGRPLNISWNRKPRILFAFAAPAGLQVPAQAHLQALREAIEPWVKIVDRDKPADRIPHVSEILTVLPDATLEKIRKLCAANEYTHVHILAHGKTFKHAGDERPGVALCSEIGQQDDVVDGERLAIALTARDATGTTKFRPTVVTLATCDSGRIGSVLTPGGSIAHELHAAGMPWVIASQFPLWMKASAIATEVLYRGILAGDDPRWVLYKLRQRLRTDSPGTHDWASIVAYATVPWNFERQVDAFRDRQTLARLEVKFDRLDELIGANAELEEAGTCPVTRLTESQEKEFDALCCSIRSILRDWREEPGIADSPELRARRWGMSGASEKRIAIAYSSILAKDDRSREAGRRAYLACRDYYREALEADPLNHWAMAQYLSIIATPVLTPAAAADARGQLIEDFGRLWEQARHIAARLAEQVNNQERTWALATLSELVLLGSIYDPAFDQASAATEIRRHCAHLRELLDPEDFSLLSTQRQFKRYLGCWSRPDWDDLAREALAALRGH